MIMGKPTTEPAMPELMPTSSRADGRSRRRSPRRGDAGDDAGDRRIREAASGDNDRSHHRDRTIVSACPRKRIPKSDPIEVEDAEAPTSSISIGASRKNLTRRHRPIPRRPHRLPLPRRRAARHRATGWSRSTAESPSRAITRAKATRSTWSRRREPVNELVPEPIPLDIIYEDDHFLALNKQADLIVHPARGRWTGTLVNGLVHYGKKWSLAGGNWRPGILHRLDRNTTGIMLVAKSEEAHWRLARQFENRTIQKTYIAICHGVPELLADVIDRPIGQDRYVREKQAVRKLEAGGKPAVTLYEMHRNLRHARRHRPEARASTRTTASSRVRRSSFRSCKLSPKTGRTHQLRVHMAAHRPPDGRRHDVRRPSLPLARRQARGFSPAGSARRRDHLRVQPAGVTLRKDDLCPPRDARDYDRL